MIGWHSTSTDFVAFDEAFFGSNPDNHPNGALGVWVFTDPQYNGCFGSRVLEIEFMPAKTLDMTVRELMKLSLGGEKDEDGVRFFQELRRTYLAQGYQAIRVIEKDGHCDMAIILDLGAIKAIADASIAQAA